MELTITTTYWIQIDKIIEMIHKYDMTIEEAIDEYIDSLEDESIIYELIGDRERDQILSEVKYQLKEENK